MTSARERVLELVASGKISPADGDQLLRAMERPAPGGWRAVFAPMDAFPLEATLTASVVLAALTAVMARLGIQFDGALDVHMTGEPVSWAQAVAMAAADWPLAAVAAWGVAYWGSRSTRFVDVLVALGLARLPLLLLGLVALAAGPVLPQDGPTPRALMVAAATLPLAGWSITLFVMGFRTASGLRGGRFAALVVAALVAAEVVSKVALVALPL